MSRLEPLNSAFGIGLDNAEGFAQIGRTLRNGAPINRHAQADLWNYCLGRLEIIRELEAENERLGEKIERGERSHTITLNLLEKALEGLTSWRDEVRRRDELLDRMV